MAKCTHVNCFVNLALFFSSNCAFLAEKLTLSIIRLVGQTSKAGISKECTFHK